MNETKICANCGAEYPIEDMYQAEGDWLCEDCADRLTAICDHCAERVYEENAVEDDTRTLCDHCFDEYYVRCDDCGRIIHRDRAYWDNDDNACCASCWDEHSEVIHEYSYTPDLVFHGKGLRHFGVELEIDDGGTVNSNAQKLLDIANKDEGNLYDDHSLVTVEPFIVKMYMKSLANRHFFKKKLDTNRDTHCIKIGVQLWWSRGELNPCPKAYPRGLLRAQFVD